MSDSAYLTLMLTGPMQSWGFASRFQRRTTGMHPTKSGVLGLICAAMGLAKGSSEERHVLPKLAALRMTTITIPRTVEGTSSHLPMRRIEDYHTVLDTRRASGALNKDAVVTYRQYLIDIRFGVIFKGNRDLLEKVAVSLQDPRWGTWLGRKSCIPAEPIYRGVFANVDEAHRSLIGELPLDDFTIIADAEQFEEGTDSLNDQPISFGEVTSSGADKRKFVHRRIKVQPGRA